MTTETEIRESLAEVTEDAIELSKSNAGAFAAIWYDERSQGYHAAISLLGEAEDLQPIADEKGWELICVVYCPLDV